MGEASKYYTPEIEEFHVGFEYELFDEDDLEWSKLVIKTQSDLVHTTAFLDFNKIRVKHLDREDILECGFHYSALAKRYFIKESLTDVERSGIWMEEIGPNQYQITNCMLPMHSIVFKGTIKNKSELKRILKQLGI